MKATSLKRKFKFKTFDLPDINPSYSVERIRDIYSGTYPEIINTQIKSKQTKTQISYEFVAKNGTHG